MSAVKVRGHELHPACAILPPMTNEEMAALVADIKEHGQRVPIVRWKGVILDGRHRLEACWQVGRAPTFTEWHGIGSPTAYVLSMNVRRRHLTPAQRAALAAESLALFEEEAKGRQREHGGTAPGRAAPEKHSPPAGGECSTPTRAKTAAAEAAKVSGSSERSVERAARIGKEASELLEEVKAGRTSLKEAERKIAKPRGVDTTDHVAAFRRLAGVVTRANSAAGSWGLYSTTGSNTGPQVKAIESIVRAGEVAGLGGDFSVWSAGALMAAELMTSVADAARRIAKEAEVEERSRKAVAARAGRDAAKRKARTAKRSRRRAKPNRLKRRRAR